MLEIIKQIKRFFLLCVIAEMCYPGMDRSLILERFREFQ